MTLRVEHLIVKTNERILVTDLSFTLEAHQRLSIIGPSGSGKTTLVKAILGLTKHFEVTGSIYFAEKLLQHNNKQHMPLQARKFGYIPQDLALWPHLTVSQAVQLAARFSDNKKRYAGGWAKELLWLCGLEGQKNHLPFALSGGEKQRLALARALAGTPRLLVLDEPFSALDIVAKDKLIDLVKHFHSLFSFTAIFISHDIIEACALGQQIMVIETGRKIWLGEQKHLGKTNFTDQWNPLASTLSLHSLPS